MLRMQTMRCGQVSNSISLTRASPVLAMTGSLRQRTEEPGGEVGNGRMHRSTMFLKESAPSIDKIKAVNCALRH